MENYIYLKNFFANEMNVHFLNNNEIMSIYLVLCSYINCNLYDYVRKSKKNKKKVIETLEAILLNGKYLDVKK